MVEMYYLKLRNHARDLGKVLLQFWIEKKHLDATLACPGRNIECHKIVLAYCSKLLDELITMNRNPHPVIILLDIPSKPLRDLVKFMYRGEICISSTEFSEFVKYARKLKMKGFIDGAAGKIFDFNVLQISDNDVFKDTILTERIQQQLQSSQFQPIVLLERIRLSTENPPKKKVRFSTDFLQIEYKYETRLELESIDITGTEEKLLISKNEKFYKPGKCCKRRSEVDESR